VAKIRKVGHVVLGVRDPERSIKFYTGALGMQLVVALVPAEDSQARVPASPEVPASLVRLGRTARFRQAVTASAAALDLDTDEFSAQLVAALAALAHSMGKDLAEADWWRLLDALLLIAAHPSIS